MLGASVGPYRILERLGAGGMGEVFLAEDSRLRRLVALKTLSARRLAEPGARRRLLREARAAANLTHPNIAAIYDIVESGEQTHIVMEYVRGETLAEVIRLGPLPPPRVVDVALQLADALAAAHALGIVHRDFKPANVVLTPEGQAKILDFGLAQYLVEEDDPSSSVDITSDGLHIVGTPPYMSPEQLQGHRLDARSDLYSFGVVLFEMLTGRRPHAGRDPYLLLSSIASDSAPSARRANATVPEDLDHIVSRALAREPGDRYASATALRADLVRVADRLGDVSTRAAPTGGVALWKDGKWPVVRVAFVVLAAAIGLRMVSRPTARPPDVRPVSADTERRPPPPAAGKTDAAVPRVVLLPLTNAAGGVGDDLTRRFEGSILQRFARITSLEVVSVDASVRSRARVDPVAIAREAGAASVLTGTVSQTGEEIHVQCQLLDGKTATVRWEQAYGARRDQVLELEGRLVVDVARNLSAQLSPLDLERLTQVPTASSEAYDLYAKGRLLAEQRDESSLRRALAYFQEAVVVDDRFAGAFAATANVHETLYYYGYASARDTLPRARSAAIRALELDPANAEAHTIIGDLRTNDWDWKAAEASYQRAIELGPGRAPTFHSYAIFLAIAGRLDPALAAIQRAVALDPFSVPLRATRGWLHYLRHEPAQALRDLEIVAARDPTFLQGRIELAKVYGVLGHFDKARRLLESVVGAKDDSEAAAVLASLQARAGHEAAARQILARLRRSSAVPPGRVAIVAGALGEIDLAVAHLEKAFQQRDFTVTFILVEPLFDPLRGDPRFQRLSALVESGTPASSEKLAASRSSP